MQFFSNSSKEKGKTAIVASPQTSIMFKQTHSYHQEQQPNNTIRVLWKLVVMWWYYIFH